MKSRLLVFIAIVCSASLAFAQAPAPAPAPAAAPKPAQTPKLLPPAAIPPVPAPPAAPAPPALPFLQAPPAPPKGEFQAVNVNVTLTIAEEGGNGLPVKKTITIITADGFSGSARETATPSTPTQLNADATPTILSSGKLRVSYSIQYTAGQNPIAPAETRARTDIRLNQVVILESGKPLKVWEGSDPITDRKVVVEITATTMK